MLIDLHAYTSHSGGPSLEDVVANAKATGMDAVCIVDRESSGDTARAVASCAFDGFPVFVGVELSTRSGDVIVLVPEIDPFLTREEWREVSVLEKPDIQGVVELASRHGGVVLLAQPYDRSRKIVPGDALFAMSGLSGVEIGTSRTDHRGTVTAIEAIGKSSFPAFAGSAGRVGGEQFWLTLFATSFDTQAGLVHALRGGEFWPVHVTSGRPVVQQRSGGRREGGRGERDGGGKRPEGGRSDGGRRDGGRRDGGRGRSRGGARPS